MTDPDLQQLIDLSAASIASFVMNEQDSFFLAKTHKDNSEIREDEIIILTITRRFAKPEIQPMVAETELIAV